ncbi:MAG: 30S ribosomal protein S8 [Candidatus Parcubacteria bacterium]|nr:30S ribosomal protein S8 [Candidatus Parcubacteria bacterium]
MTITDPISDMLTRLRNAIAVKHTNTKLPYSKLKLAILEILAKEGMVGEVSKVGRGTTKSLEVTLKYDDGQSVIHEVERISKPSNRIYLKATDIYSPKNRYGFYIISTSKGLMTSKDARKNHLGGEVLLSIW